MTPYHKDYWDYSWGEWMLTMKVTLKDGSRLGIGFSGFRGTSDLEIVDRAIKNTGL